MDIPKSFDHAVERSRDPASTSGYRFACYVMALTIDGARAEAELRRDKISSTPFPNG